MYPRHRLDGLGDAIYGVSMTLLVLDIRIPDGARVVDSAGFAQVLQSLGPNMLPYVISFLVLSSGWLAAIRVVSSAHMLGPGYVRWWRPHMLLVTMMPFSTIAVARFGSVALPVAIYAATVGLMNVCATGMLLASDAARDAVFVERRKRLLVRVGMSVIIAALSPWLHAYALLGYLLNNTPLHLPAFVKRPASAEAAD